MKNLKQTGKSARNGNAPSPYTKYKKKPHKYSANYYQWRSDRLAGRITLELKTWKSEDREKAREFKMAA